MDFNFVTARVATGAAINGQADVDVLVQSGITHIIDCRAEFDDSIILARQPQITYLFNGVLDDGLPKPVSWFQRSIEFALPALVWPKNKIYAHCAAGVNRGPSTALAILMAQGLTQDQAHNLIKLARPQVNLIYENDAAAAVKALGYV